jgi:hypothetical protein
MTLPSHEPFALKFRKENNRRCRRKEWSAGRRRDLYIPIPIPILVSVAPSENSDNLHTPPMHSSVGIFSKTQKNQKAMSFPASPSRTMNREENNFKPQTHSRTTTTKKSTVRVAQEGGGGSYTPGLRAVTCDFLTVQVCLKSGGSD